MYQNLLPLVIVLILNRVKEHAKCLMIDMLAKQKDIFIRSNYINYYSLVVRRSHRLRIFGEVMSNSKTVYSYVFKRKCPLCGQRIKGEHISLYDCLKMMTERISTLEDELLIRKLNDFHLSSRPPSKG